MIDPNNMPSGYNWFPTLALTAFAAVGGMIGYLYRTVQTGETVHIGRSFVEMMASGFIGSIVGMVCHAYQVDYSWTVVIVGISGWNAKITVEILQGLIKKRLEVKHVKPNDDS